MFCYNANEISKYVHKVFYGKWSNTIMNYCIPDKFSTLIFIKKKWSFQRNLIILDFHIILNCRIFFTSIVSRIYAYSMHIYYSSYFFFLI